jgi:general secretion pathway protein D
MQFNLKNNIILWCALCAFTGYTHGLARKNKNMLLASADAQVIIPEGALDQEPDFSAAPDELEPSQEHVHTVHSADEEAQNFFEHESKKAIQKVDNGAFRMGHYEDYDTQNKRIITPTIVYPRSATDDPDDKIEVNLEGADLQNVLDWISSVMHVTFLSDDNIVPSGKYKAAGHAITFTTHTPLTKKRVWDLFMSWLDMVGLAAVPGAHTDFYKIVTSTDDKAPLYANRSPLPSYINVHWNNLPNNDMRIRYVYLLENTTVAMLQDIIKSFRSNTGVFQPLQEQNGFILTDKAANVRSIMHIIEELDKVSMPEGLAVMRLKHADAEDVKKMYDALTETEKKGSVAERLFGAKKQSTEMFFPVDTRLIAEKRTNSLIVLGTREGIEKVEKFIKLHIDKGVELPYSPLYIYELQYASAKDVADILTKVTAYDRQNPASMLGGVRDGDKFFKPMTFIAEGEPGGNRLLISADKEDYFHIREVIKKIDVKQPQIGIEVLVLDVTAHNSKELGTSMRNKRPDTIGQSIQYQVSGLPRNGALTGPVVTNLTTTGPNVGLLANLISLATGQSPGSTLVSLGTAATQGVWALFKVLETYAHTTIVSQPFLLTTNNYPSQIKFGETRRVATATISSTSVAEAFDDYSAFLQLDVKPLINSEGFINLTVSVQVNSFVPGVTSDNTRNIQTINTSANVGNGEVLALGGLIRHDDTGVEARVPILGSIPIVGWFFKNKVKTHDKKNLLIFISPRIIEPRLEGGVGPYTHHKAEVGKESVFNSMRPQDKRDPIHRWFFGDHRAPNVDQVNAFVDRGATPERIDVRTSIMYENRTTPLDMTCPPVPYAGAAAVPQKQTEFLAAPLNKDKRRSIVAFMPHDGSKEAAS